MTLVYVGENTLNLTAGKHYECTHFIGKFVKVRLPDEMSCVAQRKDFQLLSETGI